MVDENALSTIGKAVSYRVNQRAELCHHSVFLNVLNCRKFEPRNGGRKNEQDFTYKINEGE